MTFTDLDKIPVPEVIFSSHQLSDILTFIDDCLGDLYDDQVKLKHFGKALDYKIKGFRKCRKAVEKIAINKVKPAAVAKLPRADFDDGAAEDEDNLDFAEKKAIIIEALRAGNSRTVDLIDYCQRRGVFNGSKSLEVEFYYLTSRATDEVKRVAPDVWGLKQAS